jgi:hypothetical protein
VTRFQSSQGSKTGPYHVRVTKVSNPPSHTGHAQDHKSMRFKQHVPTSLLRSEIVLKSSRGLWDSVNCAWGVMGRSVRHLKSNRSPSLTDIEVCCQLMCVERNSRRPPRDIWSLRQTAACHSFHASTKKNCILLHPNGEPKAQSSLNYSLHLLHN